MARFKVAFQLNHVFACVSSGAPEAELLRAAGLVEGSPNTHPGQGTANRRFFFESGFLELLYVRDELEAQSDFTGPTRLWQRWCERGKAANPFGVCFSSSSGMGAVVPFAVREYRPAYLPEGRCILFADGLRLSEPEVFFLSWPQDPSPPGPEPTMHALGLHKMLSVSIGLSDPSSISKSLSALADAGYLRIHHSDVPELVLEVLSDEEVRLDVPELGISIVGHPGERSRIAI